MVKLPKRTICVIAAVAALLLLIILYRPLERLATCKSNTDCAFCTNAGKNAQGKCVGGKCSEDSMRNLSYPGKCRV